MLKLKSTIFNRKVFEFKYKKEIEREITKRIKFYLIQNYYEVKSYIFFSNNKIDIFLKDLENFNFTPIQEKIFDLVDDKEVYITFYDIDTKDFILKDRLFLKNKEIERKKQKELREKAEKSKSDKIKKKEECAKKRQDLRKLIQLKNSKTSNKKKFLEKCKKYEPILSKIGVVKKQLGYYENKDYKFFIKKMQAYHKESKKWFGLNQTIKRINNNKNENEKI